MLVFRNWGISIKQQDAEELFLCAFKKTLEYIGKHSSFRGIVRHFRKHAYPLFCREGGEKIDTTFFAQFHRREKWLVCRNSWEHNAS